jgi:hypothetical protein
MMVHLQAHHITVRGALFQQVDSQKIMPYIYLCPFLL